MKIFRLLILWVFFVGHIDIDIEIEITLYFYILKVYEGRV